MRTEHVPTRILAASLHRDVVGDTKIDDHIVEWRILLWLQASEHREAASKVQGFRNTVELALESGQRECLPGHLVWTVVSGKGCSKKGQPSLSWPQ